MPRTCKWNAEGCRITAHKLSNEMPKKGTSEVFDLRYQNQKGSQNLRFNEKHPSLRGLICLQYIRGLAQDCSNSVANALELLQSCDEPLICNINKYQRGLIIIAMIRIMWLVWRLVCSEVIAAQGIDAPRDWILRPTCWHNSFAPRQVGHLSNLSLSAGCSDYHRPGLNDRWIRDM